MTPELKRACELVFQEHKASAIPINWTKDVFRGRLSFGLSAMAKEILVKKNIIYSPNPSKKIFTTINPAIAAAFTVEEAEELIQNKVVPVPVTEITSIRAEQDLVVFQQTEINNRVVLRIAGEASDVTSNMFKPKWYTSTLFYYFVWPLCGAAAGAIITWAIGIAYSTFFS
jgi:hypothetical protein